MLITSALILVPPALLFRSLRNGFYAAHIIMVLAVGWWYQQRHPESAELFGVETLYTFFLLHLLFINLVVMLAYAYDKRAAVMGYWRVPERVLHALTLAGGTFGAYIAQKTFRHKTRKTSFRLVFWLTGWLQLVLAFTFFVMTH